MVVGAVVAAACYWRALAPRIDGALVVPGLTAAVDVVRDAEGVPHIFASNAGDAYFALGFVHAQDRLWQMEMNRRIAAGRVAEILGPSALPTDKFLRTLGVRRHAEATVATLDEATRRALQRYADGVNAYLDHRRRPLPVEFLLTGAPPPEPWDPADSVGWAAMMAWDLSGNWSTELMRMRLSQRLSKQQIDEFIAPYPGDPGSRDRPMPTADYTALYRQLRAASERLAALELSVPENLVEGLGSNNWVVDGAHSSTGKPLLANDPHLGLSAPSVWYFAQLSAPGLSVIGATLPALPFVVLGRTDRIAWGFTNTGPDTQDLYIEEIHEDKARGPNGWEPLRMRSEIIHVKGAADVTLTVRESRHGPLISDVSNSAGRAAQIIGAERYAIAFDWALMLPGDKSLQAGLAINRARNWPEFVAAVRDWGSPEQNMVYADVDGNIGWIAPGRVPIRRSDNDLMGQAPAPGWDARYDWVGFVPFDELPQQLNPPKGWIATANQKVIDDDFRPYLTSEWAPPYRARRIGELLDAKPRHDLESFAAMQADQRSLAAIELLPVLLSTAPASDLAREALALLSKWDGTMASDRPEPVIYNAWMRELTRLIYADELGPELFADYWGLRQVFVSNVLRDVDGESIWCDDINTPRVETCAELQSRALDLATADLARRLGSDTGKWRWGDLHYARAEHRPFSHVPALARWFDLRIAVGGDSYTVDAMQNTIGNDSEPFVSTHGPSLRALYDLSNLENSRYIHSTGQSGNRLSWLYDNFVERWGAGQYIAMRMDRGAVEQGAMGTLRLSP